MKRKARGYLVPDTDDEEDDADEEMDNILAEIRPARKPSQTSKGKRKVISVTRSDDKADGDVDPTRHASGPLSEHGQQEARALGDQTWSAAEALARKYGKSVTSIMQAAGLGIQNARTGKNFSNMFRSWYASCHGASSESELPACF